MASVEKTGQSVNGQIQISVENVVKVKVETSRAQFPVDGDVTIIRDAVEGETPADIVHEPASDSGAVEQ